MKTPIRSPALAARIGVTKATILSWAKRGIIPCSRLPFGRYQFILEDVLEALKAIGYKEINK